MTMPGEELTALRRTRDFLRDIISHNLTYLRKNPKWVKETAYSCLRHYPWQMTLDQIYQERIAMSGLETNWNVYDPDEKGLYLVEVLGGDMLVAYWNGSEWDCDDKVLKWVTIPK